MGKEISKELHRNIILEKDSQKLISIFTQFHLIYYYVRKEKKDFAYPFFFLKDHFKFQFIQRVRGKVKV